MRVKEAFASIEWKKAFEKPKAVVFVAVGIALFSGLLLGYWFGLSGDQWKPTGDGKTIVNSRTGEIRYAATGLTIQETADLKKKLAEENAAVYEQQERERHRKQAEREARQREFDTARSVNNWAIYYKIAEFVQKHSTFQPHSIYSWRHVTAPFRESRGLTDEEALTLRKALADAAYEEPHKSDPEVHAAIAELAKWKWYQYVD